MFKITDQGIQLIMPKNLKPKHLRKLKHNLEPEAVLMYLSTIAGNRNGCLSVNRPCYEVDPLETKSENSIFSRYRKMLNPSSNHYPILKTNDYIGVEIECLIPTDAVDTDENDGSYIESLIGIFKAKHIANVSVKSDGSISSTDGYFGTEVTVLTRIDKPTNLIRVCNLLADLGAKINKSCGLHVHLDARHLSVSQVQSKGRLFSKVMPLFLKMVPESRRNNTFCRPKVSGLNGSRYAAVNLTAYKKFKTIEIRLHSGSTDFEKIYNWVRILWTIYNTESIRGTVDEVNKLTDFVKLDEDLVEYIQQRIDLFNNQSSTRPDTDQVQQVEVTNV